MICKQSGRGQSVSKRRIIDIILVLTGRAKKQYKLFQQNSQNKENRELLEFAGEFLGALALFVMLFAGLFFGGLY